MDRCDFSSILSSLRGYIGEDHGLNQTDLLYELFASFMSDADALDFDFDNGLVCRWFNGQAKVSPRITGYYHTPENRKKLAADIESKILPLLYDSAMAVQVIYELLMRDSTISDKEKRNLSKHYPCKDSRAEAAFLAAVLCFGMERSFVRRDQTFKRLASAGALSPVVSDYIFDGGVPMPCRHFCGREEELAKLHELLVQHGKVFLRGIAGIGKSELAKAYAKTHKAEYTNLLYLAYSGDLQRDITDMNFVDDLPADNEVERFRKHNRFLRTLKEDTLLIVDNFNATASQDEFLTVVLKYRCRILFTTRSRMPEHHCMELGEITDDEALFQLAASFYDEAGKNRPIIEQIIQAVHRHTLAVELAARLLETGFLEPQQVLEKLREEKAGLDVADTIHITKDGQSRKETYYDHIHKLFALFRLNQPQQETMRCLTLIPLSGIPARLFGRWMDFHDLNTVNNLSERGFIQAKPGNQIALHPMMQEVAVTELRPSIQSCHTMLESIRRTCQLHGQNTPQHKLLFQVVENVIQMAGKDDNEFYLRLLEDAFAYMQTYQYEHGMRRIITELHLLLNDPGIGSQNDRALLLDCCATLEKNPQKALKTVKAALDLLPEINTGNALLASNLNANLGGLYNLTGQVALAKQYMETGISILNEYGLLGFHDTITQSVNYAMLLFNMRKPQQGLEILQRVSRILEKAGENAGSDYALIQKSMGTLLLAAGQIEQALNHYHTAINTYAEVFRDDPQLLFDRQQEIITECRMIGLPEQALLALSGS